MNDTNAANRRREVALKNLKGRKNPNEKALKEIAVLEDRIKAKSKYRRYINSVPSTARRVAEAAGPTPV